MSRNAAHPPPRFALRAVPKPAGGQRWLAELDRATDRRYRLAVQPVVARIERSLDPGVLANRAGPGGRLHPPGPARQRWRRALARVATGHRAMITSDVAACYASIGPDAVGKALGTIGVPETRIRAVHDLLVALRRAGLHGLPVGPDASAILANVVLATADRAVRGAGCDVLRWVDDVAIVGPDCRTVLRAFHAWTQALGEIGLAPHDGKTRLLRREDLPGIGQAIPSTSCRAMAVR